jgi:hypothetical protein
VLLLALVMGCKQDPDPDTKTPDPDPPLTKNITVPAITAFTAGVIDFGTVVSLGGWDADFPATDVTYTLVLSQGSTTLVTVNSTSATSLAAKDSGGSNLPSTGNPYTITQTFSYSKGTVSGGSRTGTVNTTGGGIWNGTPSNFPELTLSLSKAK